jgi:hypothetical protein
VGTVAPQQYGPGPLQRGDTQARVITQMGEPTERRAVAGVQGTAGARWVYVRGPMGQHTYMVDFDAQGQLLQWFNALEPERLRAIVPGMAQAEVLQRLGPPAERRRLAMEGRSLWAWRFPTYECEWFVTTFDAQQRVLDAGPMTDPRCDVDHD